MLQFLIKPKVLILFITLFLSQFSFSQNDSLVLSNNDVIVGELKSMKQGVAAIETDYSDSDFKIDWEEVKTIHTQSEFLITIKSGERFNGSLKSFDGDKVHILNAEDTLASVLKNNVVFLNVVKTDFLSNIKVSLGVGYNFTKADNLSQFSVRSTIGYRAKRWSLNANYNDIRSSQDDAESVKRLDASLAYQFYLKKNWFTHTEVSWLSNTEQNINLRTLGKLGIGRFLIQTNNSYWAMQVGVSYNNENFEIEGVKKENNSAEAFLGTGLDLYDIGDLSLMTTATVYPSLTESERWRFDYKLDVKYDLPLDFFVNFGITLNYDNKPVETASKTDYVFQTTFGWDF